jgi:hypothetical protein
MLIKFKNDYTKIFSIIALTCVFSVITYTTEAQSSRQEKINGAQEDLKKIKNNGLVIVFPTNAPLIDQLRSRGLEDKAQVEEQKIVNYNLRLIDLFKNYTYGPIYYTHTSDLESANQTTELLVSDLEGNRVAIDPNTVLYLNPKKFHTNNTSYSGFGIHDKNFNYLQRPFPYFIFKRDGLIIFQKSEKEMIEILQAKFLKLQNYTN